MAKHLLARVRTGRTLVAASVIAALAAGVYVTLDKGNDAGTAACRAARSPAAALAPLVGGELAAFQIASRPDDLSALAFDGPSDEAMTLAAFRGKVTLVNLWATWCAPCRREMPALDRLQAALGGDDFAVVPISVDIAERERSADFLRGVGADDLPLYTDRSTRIFEEVKKRGLALGLPVTLLLDRNGCRLGHINGPAEWDSDDGKRLIEAAINQESAPG